MSEKSKTDLFAETCRFLARSAGQFNPFPTKSVGGWIDGPVFYYEDAKLTIAAAHGTLELEVSANSTRTPLLMADTRGHIFRSYDDQIKNYNEYLKK